MSDTLSQPIEEMTELRALQAQRNERLLGDRPPSKKDSAARADFDGLGKGVAHVCFLRWGE